MTITFDDRAAATLITAAVDAAAVLRNQGSGRRLAAESAAADFSGGYARLFEHACATEAEDRGSLAGVLEDLATQVAEAKILARKEKDRIEALDEWQERDAIRAQHRALDPTGITDVQVRQSDPKPSEVPVAAPTIDAAFKPGQRTRDVGPKSGGGTSSAHPEHLRAFVTASRTATLSLDTESTTVSNAWSGFTSSCSWVLLGSTSFVSGFRRLISENQSDEAWIADVAQAFEDAGATLMSTFNVTLQLTKNRPEALKNLLLTGNLTPAQVAIAWALRVRVG